jgi:chromosome segregation ATPase
MSEETPNKVLEYRVATLEGAVVEIKSAVKSIDSSLQTLAKLEVHHTETRDSMARAFMELTDHETRVRAIEAEMPTMKMIRNWVVAGVVGVVSMMGAALVTLMIKMPSSALSPEVEPQVIQTPVYRASSNNRFNQ